MNQLLCGVVEGDELFPIAQAVARAFEELQNPAGSFLEKGDGFCPLKASYKEDFGGVWLPSNLSWSGVPNEIRNLAIQTLRAGDTKFSRMTREELCKHIREVLEISLQYNRRDHRIYLIRRLTTRDDIADGGLVWLVGDGTSYDLSAKYRLTQWECHSRRPHCCAPIRSPLHVQTTRWSEDIRVSAEEVYERIFAGDSKAVDEALRMISEAITRHQRDHEGHTGRLLDHFNRH